jgi:hypothetical protein
MTSLIELGDITVRVARKDIKHVHLSVYPPSGAVRVAAPMHMKLDTIRLFAIAKLGWIKQQQKVLRAQERETPRKYLNRESHHVWGRRYLLKLVEHDAAPSVQLQHSKLVLRVRPEADESAREAVIAAWYRNVLKDAVAALIAKYESRLKVKVRAFYVQQMKTKWGSCNSAAGTIRLNTELAKKPRECLEYIVLHEIAHLRVPNHSPSFVALMDRHMPDWRDTRALLNRLPARHERWTY